MKEIIVTTVLVICWLCSTNDYRIKPNFADGFNTVIFGLLVMGYIGLKLYLGM